MRANQGRRQLELQEITESESEDESAGKEDNTLRVAGESELKNATQGRTSVKNEPLSECRHYWLIDSDDVGVCKYCGQKKDFRSIREPTQKIVTKKAPNENKPKRINNPWGRKGKPGNLPE